MRDQAYKNFRKVMEEYHSFSATTAQYPHAGTGDDREFSYLALGLAGETGEAVDVIKKALRREQLTSQDIQKLKGELGDILYYWTRICYAANLSPADIMRHNVDKLTERNSTGQIKDRNDT